MHHKPQWGLPWDWATVSLVGSQWLMGWSVAWVFNDSLDKKCYVALTRMLSIRWDKLIKFALIVPASFAIDFILWSGDHICWILHDITIHYACRATLSPGHEHSSFSGVHQSGAYSDFMCSGKHSRLSKRHAPYKSWGWTQSKGKGNVSVSLSECLNGREAPVSM